MSTEIKQPATQKKSQPNLDFAAQYKTLASSKTWSCDKIPMQRMTNVVLLATMARGSAMDYRNGLAHRSASRQRIRTNPKLAQHSHETIRGHHTHYRIATGPCAPGRRPDGKFLVFGTGNIIRAGKYTHGDSVAATFRMIRCLRNIGALGPSASPLAMCCPNSVISAEYKPKLDPQKMKWHWRCTSTSRFPGTAVFVEGGVVPEVYPNAGRLIMPGVRKPEQLILATDQLVDTLSQCHKE